MLEVVDITQVVPKASENSKAVKGLKCHGKTALIKNDNATPFALPRQ